MEPAKSTRLDGRGRDCLYNVSQQNHEKLEEAIKAYEKIQRTFDGLRQFHDSEGDSWYSFREHCFQTQGWGPKADYAAILKDNVKDRINQFAQVLFPNPEEQKCVKQFIQAKSEAQDSKDTEGLRLERFMNSLMDELKENRFKSNAQIEEEQARLASPEYQSGQIQGALSAKQTELNELISGLGQDLDPVITAIEYKQKTKLSAYGEGYLTKILSELELIRDNNFVQILNKKEFLTGKSYRDYVSKEHSETIDSIVADVNQIKTLFAEVESLENQLRALQPPQTSPAKEPAQPAPSTQPAPSAPPASENRPPMSENAPENPFLRWLENVLSEIAGFFARIWNVISGSSE